MEYPPDVLADSETAAPDTLKAKTNTEKADSTPAAVDVVALEIPFNKNSVALLAVPGSLSPR